MLPVQLTSLPQIGAAAKPSSRTLFSAVALGVAFVASTAGKQAGEQGAEEDGKYEPADGPER